MQFDVIKDAFATDEFISDNKYFYDKYIGYRIHGYSSHTAFVRAFGQEFLPDGLGAIHNRFEQMEATAYYQSEFERRLKTMPIDKLWNDRQSVHELLQIARHPAHKDSTRLAAVKELNVIVGITVETDAGRSKSARQLSDFYKQEGAKPANELSNKQQTEGAAVQQGQ